MRVYVPAFADDIAPITLRMADDPHPAYLRLGRCEKPLDMVIPAYAPWRRLLSGSTGVLVIIGPGAGGVIGLAATLPEAIRPDIWVAAEATI